MGEGPMMIKRTKFGICDVSRGVFLNRGIFIKAPPSFFQAYPSEFEPIPLPAQKMDLKVRTIESWDPKIGLNAPPKAKIEIPVPAPTPVAQTVISSEQKVSEVVAADVVAEAQVKEAPPKVEEAAPVAEKAPKVAARSKSKRAMKIR